MPQQPILIVGAGLAGLCCALRLREHNLPCEILEASDAVGGRVRTDVVDGFRLDRGFQVLLTAYPESRRVLDYPALNLRNFDAGALVRHGGTFRPLFDPLRHPSRVLDAATSPLLSAADKARAVKLWTEVKVPPPADLLWTGPDRSTEDELLERGFSRQAIESFFRPFFGGIFLETRLSTSSRFFRYTFRMFADGRAALPAHGMGEIPRQLAARLTDVPIRLNARVADLAELRDRTIVLATEGPEARRLAGEVAPPAPVGTPHQTCTVYYASGHPPLPSPTLLLNGEGAGIVNNVAVLSNVSPDYAPPGQSLVSASVVGGLHLDEAELERQTRAHLTEWFGTPVSGWRHLRTYRIAYALPPQDPPTLTQPERPVRLRPHLYACGDHLDQASIQGAMASGRRAADAIVADQPQSSI